MYADTHPAIIHQLGGMGARGRAGVLAHELGDRFSFNVLTAILSATAAFGAIIHYACTVPSHTVICQPINYSCHLLTVCDS